MKFEDMKNSYNCCFDDVNFANLESPVQFNDVEEAWFWFCKYDDRRDGFKRKNSAKTVSRPCFLDDIYVVVSRLYFAGKITKRHLGVLSKYGKRQIVPDDRIFEEMEDAQYWKEVMAKMKLVLVCKGIVKDETKAVCREVKIRQ